MIYSISRRTDMVAFHVAEIITRLNRSRRLEGMVLWTKDPRNIIFNKELLELTKKFPTIVQLTVTGLAGTIWEPQVPPLEAFLPQLREIAEIFPREAIKWRFDPIIATPNFRERFCKCKDLLHKALGDMNYVTVSFADPYRHAVARTNRSGLPWPRPAPEEKAETIAFMAGEFKNTFSGKNAAIRLCCEPDLLHLPGVGMAKCVDSREFDRLYGTCLKDKPKDRGQRQACGCSQSLDIGSYEMPCFHKCLYCYAGRD